MDGGEPGHWAPLGCSPSHSKVPWLPSEEHHLVPETRHKLMKNGQDDLAWLLGSGRSGSWALRVQVSAQAPLGRTAAQA